MKTTKIHESLMFKRIVKTNNVVMISKEEIITPMEMCFHNSNIAALMLAIAGVRREYNTYLSLQSAINEAALFAMTDYFQSDEKRLEYLRVTLPAIRSFYANGFNILVNPNWDDHEI